jgi:hypothetical protein
MSLSAQELERGWAEFICADHGFLVATIPHASVRCACGKAAAPYRGSQRLRKRDIKALQNARSVSARTTQVPQKRAA